MFPATSLSFASFKQKRRYRTHSGGTNLPWTIVPPFVPLVSLRERPATFEKDDAAVNPTGGDSAQNLKPQTGARRGAVTSKAATTRSKTATAHR